MSEIEGKRAANLWNALARKIPALAKAATLEQQPQLSLDEIAGLASPKEEVETYACAVTNADAYARWGTAPPPGLLFVGPPESGKTLLTRALAAKVGTPFLLARIPRLVLQLMHMPGAIAAVLQGWRATLKEMPPTTVCFRELNFAHSDGLVNRMPPASIASVMDFVLELVDQTIELQPTLTVATTGHPDTLPASFVAPGRFERIVEVKASFPEDFVAALELHARAAEKRAGRPLFGEVDWDQVARHTSGASMGDWVRVLRAVLRSKARRDAAKGDPGPVATADLLAEAENLARRMEQLPASRGSYL
jgi:cell division protease FtsH